VAKSRKPTQERSKSESLAIDVASLSYEQAVAKIEEIADRIEAGEIGLEESIGQYELGTKLLRHCRTILEQAEQRISDLTTQMEQETSSSRRTTSSARKSSEPSSRA